jgi:hypothetical protein
LKRDNRIAELPNCNLDGATHGVDKAAKLDQAAVAGALNDPPAVDRDGRIDQIAAQRPQERENAIFVRSREPAVANHVGDQDRRDFPDFAHCAPPAAGTLVQIPARVRPKARSFYDEAD